MSELPQTSSIPRELPSLLIHRWRWVMVAVIVADIGLTLAGQPASYWADPSTVREDNRLFHSIMARGFAVSLAVDLFYIGGSFFLVGILPRRLGLTLLLSMVLGHYFGGASWLLFRYHLGVAGVVAYGVVLAAALVLAGFPRQRRD